MDQHARAQAFDRAAAALDLSREPHAVRQRVEALEKLLEGLFTLPGTNLRVGLDSIVGLVPVVGDLITAAMGTYLVWEARNLGMSRWQQARMLGHVGVDTVLGAVPLVGDIFDFAYKSNTRNLRIIRKHLDRHHPATVTVEQPRA